MLKKFAVIGHPIGHTMSPFIHNKLFCLKGISVEYVTFDIAPCDLEAAVKDSLSSLCGYNVTIPHKEAILPFIDVVDESAKKYNAVNCVSQKNGQLFGYSTDAFGFTKALSSGGVKLAGNVLVLGSGGAARTIAREACDNGCKVTLAVRESGLNKALCLKDWLEQNGGVADVSLISDVCSEFDLLVNATPVGMYPHPDAMPITKEQLSVCKAVFDAVYNPERTMLINEAQRLGIKTVGGMSMLVWQAVEAHRHWYGAEFKSSDIEARIDAANKEMARLFYEK